MIYDMMISHDIASYDIMAELLISHDIIHFVYHMISQKRGYDIIIVGYHMIS